MVAINFTKQNVSQKRDFIVLNLKIYLVRFLRELIRYKKAYGNAAFKLAVFIKLICGMAFDTILHMQLSCCWYCENV